MHDSIEKLAELFEAFPGIGRKQARRFVYFLIRKDAQYIQSLVNEIAKVKREVYQCPSCFRYHQKKDEGVCEICIRNDGTKLMIVEKDSDLENIERTKLYQGKYFVLNNTPQRGGRDKYEALTKRIQEGIQKDGLQEIIFALSLQPDAEHERIILTTILQRDFPQLTVYALGRGLSSGIEIEYADAETLKHALAGKQKYLEKKEA